MSERKHIWGSDGLRDCSDWTYISSIFCCCNKIPEVGYFIKKRRLFSFYFRGWTSQIGSSINSVSGDSLWSHMAWQWHQSGRSKNQWWNRKPGWGEDPVMMSQQASLLVDYTTSQHFCTVDHASNTWILDIKSNPSQTTPSQSSSSMLFYSMEHCLP